MKTIALEIFREFERELSSPLFFGVPLGATLNDTLIVKFLNGHGKWDCKNRWLNRALMVRHWLFPKITKPTSLPLPTGQVLIAWLDGTPRFTELVLPVIKELKKRDNCCVLYANQNVKPMVPDGVYCIAWAQVFSYVAKDWRIEYSRCKSEWAFRLKSISRKYELPKGVSEELAFSLMIASQQVTACITFLKQTRPAVIVTDYDRNAKWSCLVLAAKLFDIPTITLVHGVMSKDALGYSPVLADKIICWGEFDRDKMLAAGEPADKIIIGGCPRLSRNLTTYATNSIKKFSLDLKKPVIMFATFP